MTLPDATPVTRDWAVSVFVVWNGKVLLHRHKKLDLWLPPGGHVDLGEFPDEAAVREVLEEAGLAVELVGERALNAPGPVQLVRPRGVQLEAISPGHEHIDLVYLARPAGYYDGSLDGGEGGFDWYSRAQAERLGLSTEMSAWIDLALAEVSS